MKYYTPHSFSAQEFVPQRVFAERGESAILVMDDRILRATDAIRGYFGRRVTINNWQWGGDRQYSGFRDAGCRIGAAYSQHRFGRAVDLLVDGVPAAEVRAEIMANQECFPGITRMEDGVSWVHIDCAPIEHNGIYLFKP